MFIPAIDPGKSDRVKSASLVQPKCNDVGIDLRKIERRNIKITVCKSDERCAVERRIGFKDFSRRLVGVPGPITRLEERCVGDIELTQPRHMLRLACGR